MLHFHVYGDYRLARYDAQHSVRRGHCKNPLLSLPRRERISIRLTLPHSFQAFTRVA